MLFIVVFYVKGEKEPSLEFFLSPMSRRLRSNTVKVLRILMICVIKFSHQWFRQNLFPWWRTFSALLAICAGNSPVPGDIPAQRPVTGSFDVFFDLGLNKRWGWWFEMPSLPLWRHSNAHIRRAPRIPFQWNVFWNWEHFALKNAFEILGSAALSQTQSSSHRYRKT